MNSERRCAPHPCYWITTSSGNRNVVAPSSNCTRYMRRSRLFTSRRMRGCSLNRLRPSWSRTGFCSLQCLPTSLSAFMLLTIFSPLHFLPVIHLRPYLTIMLAIFGHNIETSGRGAAFHLSRGVENPANQRFSCFLGEV